MKTKCGHCQKICTVDDKGLTAYHRRDMVEIEHQLTLHGFEGQLNLTRCCEGSWQLPTNIVLEGLNKDKDNGNYH